MKVAARQRTILIPLHTTVWGGAEVFARNLAQELTQRGDRVIFLVPAVESIALRIPDDGDVRKLEWDLGIPSGRWRGAGAIDMWRPARRPSLDHLMAHAAESLGATTVLFQYLDEQILGSESARRHGLEVAWLLHSKLHFAIHKQLLVNRLRDAAQSSDVIFAVSRATAQSFIELRLPEDKVVPIAVGHPARSSPVPETREPALIAVVSRLTFAKGVQDILAAMPMVRSKVPAARLLVAGEGNYRQQLEKLAVRSRIADAVEFCGFVQPDSLYQRATVLAHATFDPGDSMPTNLIEAATTGLPAVATRWNGAPEFVLDGESGWLFPPRDVAMLATCLRQALTGPAETKRRGENALRRSQRFTMSATTDAMIEELERRCDASPGVASSSYQRKQEDRG